MTLHLLRRAAPARRPGASHAERHRRTSRSLDREAPAGSPAPAHAARALLEAGARPDAGERRDRRRRADPRCRRRVGRAGRRAAALASPAEPAFVAALSRPDHVLLVRTTSPATSRRTRCACVAVAGERSRRRPASIRCLVGGRRSRSRSSARPTSTAGPPCVVRAGDAPTRRRSTTSRRTTSFRRLMLDRLRLLVPGWTERTPADLGVDAGRTARLRRRPAELPAGRGRHRGLPRHRPPAVVAAPARACSSTTRSHEGCNARAWVQLELVDGVAAATIPLDGLQILSRVADVPARVPADPSDRHNRAAFAAHRSCSSRSIRPETSSRSTSARRSTAAHHRDALLHLGRPALLPADRRDARDAGRTTFPSLGRRRRPHVRGGARAADRRAGGRRPRAPARGAPDDVNCIDPRRRGWRAGRSAPGGPCADHRDRWHAADALPFPLCLSSAPTTRTAVSSSTRSASRAATSSLADHGRTVGDEALGTVPEPRLFWPRGRSRRLRAGSGRAGARPLSGPCSHSAR